MEEWEKGQGVAQDDQVCILEQWQQRRESREDPLEAAGLHQDAHFVMEVRCIRLQSELLSFPLVFRLKPSGSVHSIYDLESPSHPVSTCLTHPLPTT